MITYEDIWNKVLFNLKNEMKFFTSSDVKNIIVEDAFNRIAEEISYPRTNYSAYLTSGEYVVSTPSNFIKVNPDSHITYKTGARVTKLNPMNQTEIGRDVVLQATPSVPTEYFLEDEAKIGLYPPSTSGCIVIPYVARPTWVSTNLSTGAVMSGSINELTERCYMAAVYWTVSECLAKDDDPRAEGYNTKFWNEISRLKSQYNMMLEIRRDMKPHQRYIR